MKLTDNFRSFSGQDALLSESVTGSVYLPVEHLSKTYSMTLEQLAAYVGIELIDDVQDAFVAARAVCFDRAQTLVEAKQLQARTNIAAQKASVNLDGLSALSSVAGLSALERLADTVGLISQIGANTYGIIAVGSESGNIPSIADADERYLQSGCTVATLNEPIIAGYTESPVTLGNTGVSKTIAISGGTLVTATLTATCVFTMPTAGLGKSFTMLLKTGLGGFTAAFTGVVWNGVGTPTITATANKMDILSFVSDGSKWYGSINQGFTP